MNYFAKKNIPYLIIQLFSFIIGICIITYGLPYSLHPDESYIFKDPIKTIFNYFNLDFSTPMSLYSWCLSAWYGILFIIGKIVGKWHSFEEYKHLIILESGIILFWGRLLSVIILSFSNHIIIKLIKRFNAKESTKILVLLTFVFNPVLLASVYWIKFDITTYFSSCFLLYYFYQFFIERNYTKRKYLYFFCVVFISIRVELICFLVTLIVFDFISSKKEKHSFFDRVLFSSIIKGLIVFCVITLYPLYILNQLKGNVIDPMPLACTKTFEKSISTGIINSIKSGSIFISILSNIYFYFSLAISSLGTILLLAVLFLIKRFRLFLKFEGSFSPFLFIYFHISLFSVFILFFPYHATHYFLSISFLLLALSAIFLLNSKQNKLRTIFCYLNLFFVISLSGAFFAYVMTYKDPRLSAKEYLLKTTTKADLLAIETISMNGYHPLIDECPDVLREKSNAVKKTKKGTGLYTDLKSKQDSLNCRKILDIFTDDYYTGTDGEGKWINNYNITEFIKAAPEFYITTRDLNPDFLSPHVADFYQTVKSKYVISNSFIFNSFDFRLNFLLKTEPYFKNVYIYKKAN